MTSSPLTPPEESQADIVEHAALVASLRSAASNAIAGTFVGPVALGAMLLVGGAAPALAVGVPLVLAVVTGVLAVRTRQVASTPTLADLEPHLRPIYILLFVHGLLTGGTTLIPMDPAGLDNPMYPVLLATVTVIVAANLPTAFARTSMFLVTCVPMIAVAALSALLVGGIGIVLAVGIVVVGIILFVNARQAGAAFRTASALRIRNEALVRELEASNEQLDRLAHTDALTDIPNRAGFGRYLEARLARRGQCAVLFLDLDGFKAVNDAFGHKGGDRVLTEVAARITGVLRGEDVVARLGGDEFVVVGNATQERALDVLATRIREAIAQPIDVDGQPVQVAASIGMALASADETVESIIARADSAMYTEKRRARA